MRTFSTNRALTSIECLVVIALLVILAVVAVAQLRKAKSHTAYISCTSNLKQIGFAFRLWANDNQSHYPMQLSTNKGGTKELTSAGETYRHFFAAGNEISSPKVLVCPRDQTRTNLPWFPTNFTQFSNSNISYFIGLDADETDPHLLLSGDRNLTNNPASNGPIMMLSGQSDVGWTRELHSVEAKESAGNVGLADGGARQVSTRRLREVLANATNVVQRIMLP